MFVTHDLEVAIALADTVLVLTVGPATVKNTFRIDLPRPRRVQEVRFQPRFIRFGLGPSGKTALSVVLVFFPVFFNAFQGTREVDRDLIANARILGASEWEVTRQVVLPSAMTWIIASPHAAFGFALIGAIVGEVLGAQAGLGWFDIRRRDEEPADRGRDDHRADHLSADTKAALGGTYPASCVSMAAAYVRKNRRWCRSWSTPSSRR